MRWRRFNGHLGWNAYLTVDGRDDFSLTVERFGIPIAADGLTEQIRIVGATFTDPPRQEATRQILLSVFVTEQEAIDFIWSADYNFEFLLPRLPDVEAWVMAQLV